MQADNKFNFTFYKAKSDCRAENYHAAIKRKRTTFSKLPPFLLPSVKTEWLFKTEYCITQENEPLCPYTFLARERLCDVICAKRDSVKSMEQIRKDR